MILSPRPSIAFVFSLYALLATHAAAATITPISGTRGVVVGIFNETGGGDSRSGPISGPWEGQVSITRPLSREGVAVGTMTCIAEQRSNIAAQSITDSGRIAIDAIVNGATVVGQAQSRINLTFSIDTETEFMLRLFEPIAAPFDGMTLVAVFRDSDGSQVRAVNDRIPGPAFGTLQPGIYRIETSMYHFFQPPRAANGDTNYSWAFIIPTPTTAPVASLGFLIIARRHRSV